MDGIRTFDNLPRLVEHPPAYGNKPDNGHGDGHLEEQTQGLSMNYAGSVMRKRVSPGLLVTVTVPPWDFTIA